MRRVAVTGMAGITALDQGDQGRHGADPKTMDWIPDN